MPRANGTTTAPGRRTLAQGATWRELLFQLIQVPLTAIGLVWLLTAGMVAALAAATIVGLPLTLWFLERSRQVVSPTRRLTEWLLRRAIPAPPELVGRLQERLRHPALWRQVAYLAVGTAVAITAATVTLTILLTGAAALAAPVWSRHGSAISFLVAAGGLLLLGVWPSLNRVLAQMQGWTIATMLGQTSTERRLAAALTARDTTVQGADTTLRRIERELHDGTQARLVSMAMLLGDVLDQVQHGSAVKNVEPQLESALATTKETLTELRALVRGIHPPVLDSGLEPALTSAVARIALPIDIQVDLPERPPAVLESLIYFSVLELLTNVQKHAKATAVCVCVFETEGQLIAQVTDDGRGGVALRTGAGTGLVGIAERAASVDGDFRLLSPDGGPTEARITLPWKKTT